MFSDSLLESHCATGSWDHGSHRGWTTLLSFALQGFGISLLLLLPLIYTQGLPQLRSLDVLGVPQPLPAPPVRSLERSAVATQSNLDHGVLIPARDIPREIATIAEEVAPPQVDLNEIGVLGAPGDTRSRGIINSIGNWMATMVPPVPSPTAHPPRVSRMMEGNLIHRIQPEYPPLAKTARIQGAVVLRALISKDGSIEDLRVLSGHPMLVRAAIDAVSQWRYRPYYLNGEPVEVETQVTVNFILAGR
jgi:periplasmic protein TonB